MDDYQKYIEDGKFLKWIFDPEPRRRSHHRGKRESTAGKTSGTHHLAGSIVSTGLPAGYKSRISQIFSRKRKLTLEMIRRLHEKLKILLEALIADY